ncbi:MAG: hypothetical protein COC00_007520 [Rhizobiales bacterium]|nr:hypothetical protein [Hyphomicrobiales bacterium]
MDKLQNIPSVRFNVPDGQSFRKSVQRLRWFKSTFEEQVQAVSIRTGIDYDTNAQILTSCFLQWVRAIEKIKPSNPEDRLAFVGFAAGKMLKELIVNDPLVLNKTPKVMDLDFPEYFWPQGYVYVSYCLNVRQFILQQDFHTQEQNSDSIDEIRTWWSFKENTVEVSDYAISYLDLFAGEEPNWNSPGQFNRKRKLEQFLEGHDSLTAELELPKKSDRH